MGLDAAALQTLIEKATLVGALVWAVLALVNGWVVPRSVHDRVLASEADWKARHDRISSIAEMVLRAKVGA